jgi:hypothetical protein
VRKIWVIDFPPLLGPSLQLSVPAFFLLLACWLIDFEVVVKFLGCSPVHQAAVMQFPIEVNAIDSLFLRQSSE